jgi:hypothetical protein
MGKSIRTMHDASNRQLVLKTMQMELKKMKEHSKEWHRLTMQINEMVAENYLRYITK